jgi:hypothetical protein
MARPVKKKGPDKLIVIAALAVVLIIGAILLFRWMMRDTCPGIVDFTVAGEQVAGAEISFTDITGTEATSWEWDFGDATPGASGNEVNHTYATAGTYKVSLTVNGECQQVRDIEVLAPVEMEEVEEERIQVVVKGPKVAYVGEPVTFSDETPGAVSWEWEFSESGEIDSREKKATYTFEKRGPHEVYLAVNGQRGNPPVMVVEVKKKKDVQAAPKPPKPDGGGTGKSAPAAAPAPKAPPINEAVFFKTIAEEFKKDLPDFEKALGKYFGGDLSLVKVKEPGKEPAKIQNWLNALMVKDGKHGYTKAKFVADKDGEIVLVELSK